jgi:hypothetical protein
MWAKFLVYEDILNAPEALTIWAKYAIYEAIDKIPEICRHMGSIWSKVDYGGVKWRAQLHVYLSIYILVIISSKLVVYFMVDTL